MKNLLVIWLVVIWLFCIDSNAQSRRAGAVVVQDRANQRVPQTTPTPVLKPVGARSVTETPGVADEDGVVAVDTRLVTVPVRVLDRKGHFVEGLTKENFTVFQDGVEQDIAYFTNEEQPFTVALVLDMSYSTKFKIAEIQSAAIAFIDQLRPQDKVMVVSFDEDVHMLCEATNDRQRIYGAIRSTKIQTGTSLYEAIDLVINGRLKYVQGRKAVILFTDGVDTTSSRSDGMQNLHDALGVDALIYPIRYDTYADVQAMKNKGTVVNRPTPGGGVPGTSPTAVRFPPPEELPPVIGEPGNRGTSAEEYRRAKAYLEQLASRTGGTIYEANTTSYLNYAFSKIASELREYYSLGFYPADVQVGRQRRLKVKVDRANVVVRAKDNYIVANAKKKKST